MGRWLGGFAGIGIGLCLGLAASAAGAERYELEPGASRVGFEARHLHFLKPVRGRFTELVGSIEIETDESGELVATGVDVRIEAASLDTGITLRDDHLRSRFFDTEQHPWIRFESRHRLTRGATALDGWLTVKGVRREVSLALSELAPVVASDGREGIACLATTVLHRREFDVVESLAREPGSIFQVMGRGVDGLIDDPVVVKIRVVAWPSEPLAGR